MKTNFLFGLFLSLSVNIAAQQTQNITIKLSNNWRIDQPDAPVVLKINDLNPGFQVQSAIVKDGSTEIPSQLDDLNEDLKADELAFVIDMPAKSHKKIDITLSSAKRNKQYPPRVFAQLLARDAKNQQHAPIQAVTAPGTTDFYSMIQGHGPMFESELVGYRVYFNPKQTIDPYGKFQKRLELEECQFYPNDEQLQRGFGDDVLLVGNSGGIGALKGWNGTKATHIEPVAFRTQRILSAGPIRTVVEVEVKGWEYQGKLLTMTSRYILYAGHRDLLIENRFKEALSGETFCAGVQNIKGNETISHSDHEGLIGSWGTYWPVNDTVKYAKETIGIATYIPKKYVKSEVKDEDNFLYTISAQGKKRFHYYTMFTSRKETFGYTTPEAWFTYMKTWKEILEHPIQVQIIKK